MPRPVKIFKNTSKDIFKTSKNYCRKMSCVNGVNSINAYIPLWYKYIHKLNYNKYKILIYNEKVKIFRFKKTKRDLW